MANVKPDDIPGVIFGDQYGSTCRSEVQRVKEKYFEL